MIHFFYNLKTEDSILRVLGRNNVFIFKENVYVYLSDHQTVDF